MTKPEGRFGGHHALMRRLHLDHTGHLEAMTARLDTQTEAMMTPFRAARDLLATVPPATPSPCNQPPPDPAPPRTRLR